MKYISIFYILLISFNTFSSKFLENKILSFGDADEITTITKDDETALCEAINTLNKSGGTIYINTPIINISSKCQITLSGSTAGGLIGIKQSDDTYPRLDFTKARKENPGQAGIKISGSNQYVKYLIIDKSAGKGIWITGNKNLIDHVITRYSNASGIQISHGGESNTINYAYAYRNCDVGGYGGGADGFSPKLDAKKSVFNYCYAWDNSDDGWDAYDKEGDVTDYIEINHSACWNNGNVDVFTGKYDYNNGAPLDKNMWTIEMLMESDSNFESNYKNKKFSYENGKINGESAASWANQATKKMNPNGFKFGSAITPKSADIVRKCDFCSAFPIIERSSK